MPLRYLKRFPELFGAMKATPQWPALIAGYLRLAAPFPLRLSFRDGNCVDLQNREDLATLWLVFFSLTYPLLPGDRRIVDCGANIGAFTLYAATQLPSARIVSIEPFPETFSRFSSMIADNHLENRVTAIRAALTGSAGTVLFDDRPAVGSQFRSISSTGVAVEGIPLVSLLDKAEWDFVDLLKIDIEGGEYDALLSTSPQVLRRISRIAMEYHPDPRKAELLRYLEQAGFSVQSERDDGGGYGIVHLIRK